MKREDRKNFAVIRLFHGNHSGKIGFYNCQEIGLSRAMIPLGYHCYVFFPDLSEKAYSRKQIEEHLEVIYCPVRVIGGHSHFDWNILKEYHIDLLQIESDNQIFAPNLSRFCDKNNIIFYNYIGTIKSDTNNRMKASMLSLLFERNLRQYRTHKCFAKTESVKDSLEKKKVKNVEVAPVGLDTGIISQVGGDKQTIRLEKNIAQDKEVLLYVGHMEEYKKPLSFVKLLKKLDDKYIGIMIGDGSLSDVVDKEIKQSGLEKRICRIKKIPNDEIHEYYMLCDYFLNFNEHEIFGMAILEAMYQGATVVAVHAPGPDMIIEDGKSGFLVQNESEMLELIQKNPFLQREDVQGRVISEFTWEKTAGKIDNWYHQKLQEK
jgi:1,2-diacylglycerol 3-alpha-glucosyltransferase